MRTRIALIMLTACILLITGCGDSNSAEDPTRTDSQMVENTEQTDIEEIIATDGVADYPAAIMVNDTVYLMEGGIAVLYENEWDEEVTGDYTDYVFTAEFSI